MKSDLLDTAILFQKLTNHKTMGPMTLLRFHNRTLVVADEPMRQTLDLASRAAKTVLPVLLCGPSGTGKELIARFIHEKSSRAKSPFISVNCAAIPEGLMEAELFGYERGAFTGAINQRIGKFERANGGTLLLDEISEMSVSLQAKLLRVLQEGEIDRLGGKNSIPIQTRIIATTNRDPLVLIREGLFREDLFYRINVMRIDLLPLAGRTDAIRGLATRFIEQACLAQDRPGLRLSSAAERKILTYRWPGNVRELQNAVERAVLLADGNEIEAANFDNLRDPGISNGSSPNRLCDLEEKHIKQVLQQTSGNRTDAAELLGITTRTLRNKLKIYGDVSINDAD